MSNSPYIRAAIAQATLGLMPSIIRNTLLEEREFREDYEIDVEVKLTFGDCTFRRTELFDAIRKVLSGVTEQTVTDTEDREWNLRNESEISDLPALVMNASKQRIDLPEFVFLSPDSATRLRSLDEAAANANLPSKARESWRKILSERALEDEEIDHIYNDFRDTPVHVAQAIRREINTGQFSSSSLVPCSRRYFDRLVGGYDGSKSIRDYAAGTGRQLIEQLFNWRSCDGFLFSLLLSSHSAMTAEITVDCLGNEDCARVFDFIERQGDSLSQLGAIEIGLHILPRIPEIVPYVICLVEKLRDEDVDTSTKGLKLLSALFILVDGELSRTRLMSAEPPFYRRLASLAHAALIHRQLVRSAIDDGFCEWAISNSGPQYYMQTLADMRLEPRWNPEYAAATQMKENLLGRIMIAADKCQKKIKNKELYDLILGKGPESLQSQCEFPYPYYPGPLEGTQIRLNALPADLLETIEAQLTAEVVGPSSFVAFTNSVMFYRVDSDQVELAVKALKLANYRLADLENEPQILEIFIGFATVAAICRSSILADELRILLRRYKHDAQYDLSIEDEVKICLIASASRENLSDWREFAGEWLTELAFGEFESDEGKVFHSRLRSLCHAVPELWLTCAKGDAALMAFNASKSRDN